MTVYQHGRLYWFRVQDTEPTEIEEDVVWVDTSVFPPVPKRRNGTGGWDAFAGGAGGVSSYTFIQASPSDTWVITHPLGYPPAVTVIDTIGRVVLGDIAYSVPASEVTITFSAAFAGKAYLS